MRTFRWSCVALLTWALCGCSSDKKAAAPTPPAQSGAASSITNPKHRYGKLIELTGFRVTEQSPGKLQIRFGVVNHSIADLGDIEMKVSLKAQSAKPEDAPLAEFPCKVSLGPEEWKDVTVVIPTKLRVYELPDWQFLHAYFQIVSPPA